MKANKTSVIKQGFQEAGKRFLIVSLPLSFFALLTALCLVLAFYVPLTLILTVPFIIIPSFFSLSAINTVAPNENTHEVLGFFIMFKEYYSQIFRGGYKVIFGFLKSLAVFVVVAVILSAILCPTILYKDPGYIAFMEQIKPMTDINEIANALNDFLNSNETFKNLMIITSSASSFAAFYMFMHHFAVNSYKYNYNFLTKMPLPMQDLNLIDKTVRRENRKAFYKDFYKTNWFLIVLLILGYAGGSLITYFFIKNADPAQINVIGLFGSFVLLLLFVPYFLNTSQLVFMKYRTLYVETLIDLSKKTLADMKKSQIITDEKEQEVMKMLESQKEENKDNSDDKTE